MEPGSDEWNTLLDEAERLFLIRHFSKCTPICAQLLANLTSKVHHGLVSALICSSQRTATADSAAIWDMKHRCQSRAHCACVSVLTILLQGISTCSEVV